MERRFPNPDPFPSGPPEQWPPVVPARAPAPPPPTPPGGRAGALAIVAAAVVFAVIVSMAMGRMLTRENDRPSRTAPGSSTTTTSTAPGLGTASLPVDAVIDELIAFVESVRGHPFPFRPQILALSDQQYGERIDTWLDADRRVVERQQQLLESLQLIEPDQDLMAFIRDWQVNGSYARFDRATGIIAIRGALVDPAGRASIVAALSEALDLQVNAVDDARLSSLDADGAWALDATVEQVAAVLADTYAATLPTAARNAIDGFQAQAEQEWTAKVPPAVARAVLGGSLLRDVVGQAVSGGPDGIDALIAEPPATSEQATSLEAFQARSEPLVLSEPPSDGEVIVRDGFSARDLWIAGITETPSPRWAGGRQVTWQEGEQVCTRFRVVGDTQADSVELLELTRAWGPNGAVITVNDASVGRPAVQATRCSE